MADAQKGVGTMTKIFLLHGWTYSIDTWQGFSNCLKSQGFDPILLKIPGLTETTDKAWTLGDYSGWLKEKLNVEKGPCIVIGHSNGGRIALACAATTPEKFKLLILVDSAGVYHNDLAIRLKRFIFETVAKTAKKITYSNTLRSLFYRLIGESDYKNATPVMRQTMAQLIATDVTPILSNITTPTLIIWGRDDSITPLSDGMVLNRLIRKSKLVVIDGASHSPQITHTAQVCKLVTGEVKRYERL